MASIIALRKKYIAKDWEAVDGYYSYVHVKELDVLFDKLETLIAANQDLQDRVAALESK